MLITLKVTQKENNFFLENATQQVSGELAMFGLVFNDEFIFHNNGAINQHNLYYYSCPNP